MEVTEKGRRLGVEAARAGRGAVRVVAVGDFRRLY